MKKLLLGILLLLSMVLFGQEDDSNLENTDKRGNGHGNGHGNHDDSEDDNPQTSISDYIYVLGLVGAIYSGNRIILKNK